MQASSNWIRMIDPPMLEPAYDWQHVGLLRVVLSIINDPYVQAGGPVGVCLIALFRALHRP